MFVNNLPFTETLQMAQRDLYDIDTMLLTPLKKHKKIAKRNKYMWHAFSYCEHAIGVTFGVMATIDAAHQRYFLCGINTGLLTLGAALGFNASNIAKSYTESERQIAETISNTQDILSSASPERLHEIAEIVRNSKQKQNGN